MGGDPDSIVRSPLSHISPPPLDKKAQAHLLGALYRVMVLDKRSCSEKLRGRRKDRASAETRLKRYFDAQNWGMADWKVNNYLE